MSFWDRVKSALGIGPAATPSSPNTSPPNLTTAGIIPPSRPAPANATAAPASDFLPIARDDLLKQAEDIRRSTGWAWFGRRDIIPPASDPRTKLIDRGMVTQRLLTPDELAHMHRVGDEWAKYANRIEHIEIEARKSGEEAVEADRARRAAIKAGKKAAAAEKKASRAEAVARRKLTDITFAGRGVSSRLNDRRSDEAKLADAGFPILSTPADLAHALSVSIPALRWLCFHSDAATRIHYFQFEIPKKSGGARMVSAPHARLANAQGWVLERILAKLPTEDPAHGFVSGRSTVTNAIPHAGQDVVVNLDLEQFFPSIGFARVRHLYQRVGYSGAVATLLALLTTECPRTRVVYSGTPYFVATGPRGLPQGACTSPAISNQIARKLDRRLLALATKLGFRYTRYADDLTFSAGPGNRERVGYLIAKVRHIAADEGFTVHPKKTRVLRREQRQLVTGLVVNDRPAVPRNLVRRIRAILHRARTEGLAAQNRDGHPRFEDWLDGMIAYVGMVNPELGKRLAVARDLCGNRQDG